MRDVLRDIACEESTTAWRRPFDFLIKRNQTMTRGGKRPGADRKVGSRSKITKALGGALTELAKRHTPEMLDCLVRITREKKASASARAFAASQMLEPRLRQVC
jgi:hypothetical protein